MLLLDLPPELLLSIADQINTEADLSALCRSHRVLYSLLSDPLHRNSIRHFNSSALFWGARNGRLIPVKRLLDLGADVDVMRDGMTPLKHAACQGHTEVVKYLLDKGAGYRFVEWQPWTPLCTAAWAGHADVVRVILSHTGTKEEPRQNWDSAHPPDTNTRMLQSMFVTRGTEMKKLAVEFTVPLFMAITMAHREAAEVLMEDRRVDVNYRDRSGRTALMWALSHGHDSLISPLLNRGADPNVLDPRTGKSVLSMAIEFSKPSTVRILLGHNQVDPNLRDGRGTHPLWAALLSYDIPILQAILSRPDVDVNTTDSSNTHTPLLYAAKERQNRSVAMLLEHPAIEDLDFRDSTGKTALAYAAEAGYMKMLNHLLRKGADPSTLKASVEGSGNLAVHARRSLVGDDAGGLRAGIGIPV